MDKVIRAAVYARYSSHGQRDVSIDQQIEMAQAYAARNGYTIVAEYADRAKTGKNDNRTEFQRMLHDLPKRAFDVIILWKIDRFGRNREEIAINRYRCRKYGVQPVFVAESVPDGPEGVILSSVLEGMAEYYSLQLEQNIRRGRRYNAERCLSVGGPTPLGYRIGADRHYEAVPELVPVVRGIFESYADRHSMAEISRDLTAQGLRTKSGNPYSVESIRKILKNERYTGVYIVGDVRVEGGMPQIIDHDLWERVQELMAKNKKAPGRDWLKAEYLLTGKIYCGLCGGPIVGSSGHGKSGAKHDYYVCKKQRKGAHTCDLKPMRRDVAERVVVEALNRLLDDDALLDELADRVYAILEAEDTRMDATAEIKRQLAEADAGLANLLRALEKGIMFGAMNDRIATLEAQKAQLLAELAAQEAAKALRLTQDHIAYFLYQIRDGRAESREATQRMIDTFVHRINVYEDHMEILLNYGGSGGPDGYRREDVDLRGDVFAQSASCSTIRRLSEHQSLRIHSVRGTVVVVLSIKKS